MSEFKAFQISENFGFQIRNAQPLWIKKVQNIIYSVITFGKKGEEIKLLLGWECGSVVQGLLGMQEVLGSIPNTTKGKKKKKRLLHVYFQCTE